MYTQLLKEILLNIEFEQVHFNEFLTHCREQFADNTTALKDVDKMENEYRPDLSIRWYTYDCFLYSMLNRALRTMEVDNIIKMGFFVRDIHEQIVHLHSEQYAEQGHSASFTVFRAQGLTPINFDKLIKKKVD
jgi:hypothetical protein